jgi:hypothetical protein
MKDILQKIELGMKPFDCVVSQREDYIRVWNCYCGSIMGAYNRQLDKVCAELGMKWSRERTYGNGMISSADWEDRVRPTTPLI